MSLASSIKLSISALLTGATDLAPKSAPLNQVIAKAFSDGAGISQANLVFADTRTLAASATESLDLAGGGLTDLLGAALTFARVKAIIVVAAAANTNGVVLSRPAANGFPLFDAASDAITIAPGGFFAWVDPTAAGKVVTAGTGDLLGLANAAAGTPVNYDIYIIGAAT